MKYLLTSIFILITISVSLANMSQDSIKPLPTLVKSDNDFGFRIFSELSKNIKEENVFISPTSIAMCLTMAYNGAEGKTKQAMAKTLGFESLTADQINAANLELNTKLKSIDPKVTLNIANSLWGHKRIIFKTDFVNQNKKFYNAEVTTIDFSDPKSPNKINNWVSDKTNKKIKSIVEKLDPSQLLVLVNAIYFNGKWSKEFDKKKTKDLPFILLDNNTIDVPMMTQSGDYLYFENEALQAIRLPYGKGKLGMYIFLPKTNLIDFLSAFDEKAYSEYLSKMKFQEGDITLPRFKFEYSQTLNEALINLGMQDAFADADFSKMCDLPAFIGSVLHKTYVDVSEQGTEAAAVTSIFVATAMANEPEPFTMIVDHPFFFTISDDETDAIVFMGAVTKPKQ